MPAGGTADEAAAEESGAGEAATGAGGTVQDEKKRLTDIYQRWLAAIDRRRADVR